MFLLYGEYCQSELHKTWILLNHISAFSLDSLQHFPQQRLNPVACFLAAEVCFAYIAFNNDSCGINQYDGPTNGLLG